MPGDDRDLYDPAYVRSLFDEMANSYERMNHVTSFGFSERWRRQAIRRLDLQRGMTVHDWMTGMGEGWPAILRRIGPTGSLTAIDLSTGMLAHAVSRRMRYGSLDINVLKADVLEAAFEPESADAVVSLFGVKTMSDAQWFELADRIVTVLRPGGTFSVIEVSVPRWAPLRVLYMAYLRLAIPVLGRVLLGNPENYRMLGVYTARFGNARRLATILAGAGLEVRYADYFFGCASGVWGRKPS
jgi:ubiquinone/menaquinone biosynthesis methyltransferase